MISRNKTLSNQLIGRQILLLAVLLIIIGLSQYVILRTVLFNSTARSLHQEIMVLTPLIHHSLVHEHGPGPGPAPASSSFRHLARFLVNRLRAPGVAVMITNNAFQIVASSSNLPSAVPPITINTYAIWHHHIVVSSAIGHDYAPHGYIFLLSHTTILNSILQRDIELYSLLALVVLALIGWVGSLSVRQTLIPLHKIQKATSRIARGDFGYTEKWGDAPKELTELGEAINTMSAAIHDLFMQEKNLAAEMRRFVADASHELRTPLTAITGFLTLMQESHLSSDERARGLRTMLREAKRMNKLVNQLLTLSRIDTSPESQVKPETFALTKWIDDMLPALQSLGASHRLMLDQEPVNVYADPDRLTEILFNLMENAVRYSPPDSPIHLTITPETEQWARLVIEDSGPGIPSEDIPHVFERFYRGDRARSSQSGGSGLGLSIVEGLVHALKGDVRVENREGNSGARFIVRLPQHPGNK